MRRGAHEMPGRMDSFPGWGSDVCHPQRAAEWESGRAWAEIFQGKLEPSRGRRDWLQALLGRRPPAAPHCPLLSASLHSCTRWPVRAWTWDSAGGEGTRGPGLLEVTLKGQGKKWRKESCSLSQGL